MTSTISEAIVAALGTVLPGKATLHEPRFGSHEREYLLECLDSTFVSSVGKFVDRFEAMLAEYTGAKRAIAVVNGTAALHASLVLAGVRPGDEILIPALTFVATANAVTYCHAIPHLVEHTEETLGIDPAALASYLAEIVDLGPDGVCFNRRTGRRISACVPMHTFGHPVDLNTLASICDQYGIVLVEDAAESLGSTYQGQHTGTFGKLSCLSFNGNKIVTTGGGGAILTNDPELGVLAKHLTTTAKVPHSWAFFHDKTGYNYRMPNINAALGCAQLERLPDLVERKRALADRYREAFSNVQSVRFFTEPSGCRSNYWLNTLLLEPANSGLLEDVLKATNAAGYMTRPAWTLMSKLPMYRDCPSMDLPIAKSLESRILNIPSSAHL